MLQGVHIQRRRISLLPAHGLPLDRQRPHRSRHLPGQGSRFQLRIRIPRRPAQHARIVQPRPQRAPVRRMSRHRGRRFLHGVGTLRNRTAGQPQRPSDEHEPGRERVLGRAITRRIVYQFQSSERADRMEASWRTGYRGYLDSGGGVFPEKRRQGDSHPRTGLHRNRNAPDLLLTGFSPKNRTAVHRWCGIKVM